MLQNEASIFMSAAVTVHEKFKEDQGCILSRNIRAQFDFLKCHLDPISENSPYVIY